MCVSNVVMSECTVGVCECYNKYNLIPRHFCANGQKVWWISESNFAAVSHYRKTGRNSRHIGIGLMYQSITSHNTFPLPSVSCTLQFTVSLTVV